MSSCKFKIAAIRHVGIYRIGGDSLEKKRSKSTVRKIFEK